MGGVYVYGEDDFACYVGMAFVVAKGRNENGRRTPWQELSEEEQKKRVWDYRRATRLNLSEKALLQKYERPAKDFFPGTVAETPPHYWVAFDCVPSSETKPDTLIKQWRARERREIQRRRNAVNHVRYNGRTDMNLYYQRFNELQL